MKFWSSFEQDPQARLEYPIEWSSRLNDGEILAASTWEVISPAGDTTPIVIDQEVIGDTGTAAWISGGTEGYDYYLTNHIETNSTPLSRKDDRTIRIQIRQQ